LLRKYQEAGAISDESGLTACRGRGRIRAKAIRKIPYAAKTPNANAAIDAQISIAKFNRSPIQSAFVDCVLAKVTGFNIGNSGLLFKKLVRCKLSINQVLFGRLRQHLLHQQVHTKIRIASLTNDAIVAEFAAALTLISIYQ